MNVETLMHKLTTTTKAAPIEVVEYQPRLKGNTEILRYWLSVALILQFRTAVVWGFLALFLPQLGVTWFMVMFGLWAIRHIVPVKPKDIINALRK